MNKAEPILMAAKDAFIENGFANTSMDDVALRASTTKRTVYNNYGSKERLLEAVIDHAIEMFEAAVPALRAGPTSAEIAEFCNIVLQLVTWRAAIGLQRMVIAEGTSFPHLTQQLALRTANAMSAPLSRFLQEAGKGKTPAEETAARVIDLLTSKARLDRLVGLRKAYPSLPGKNRLDALDTLAVKAALQCLSASVPPEVSTATATVRRRKMAPSTS